MNSQKKLKKNQNDKANNLLPLIVFEDENILVVNKPEGLLTHADLKAKEFTLSDWFVKYFPRAHNVGEPLQTKTGQKIARHGIVHRLDKETSGIILLAKNQNAHGFLKEQFQKNQIKKTYLAYVHGRLKNDRGTINLPIGRSPSNFKKRSAERGARGKLREATTHYFVLARSDHFTYLNVQPETGRTHQIRVHLKAIGHSVVCDKLYGPQIKCALGFKRLALHAGEITFRNLDGRPILLKADLPEDFKIAKREFMADFNNPKK